MDVLGILVKKMLTLWQNPVFRQSLPYLLVFISFTGSIIKNLEIIPDTYFSDRKNVLNVYFVKVSWGWHLALLLPFIVLSHAHSRSQAFVLRRLSSQLVSTAIWYTCTQFFFCVEDATGSCYESQSPPVVHAEFVTKDACKRAGFQWDGYDISGHSFILSYSMLVIAEEIAPMIDVRRGGVSRTYADIVLDVLYVALNVLVAIWIWMFGCTSVYFHDISHKLLGTAFGVLGWYETYRVWYLKPFSPRRPLISKADKQLA